MTATYVYGLVSADADLPDDLTGLGPSGQVTTITHGRLSAIVSDVPTDRPLGTRDDLLAHEAVVESVAARASVLPMRFPAVVEEDGVVAELLEPHQDHFLAILGDLEGRVQFTLKGRYEEETILSEVVASEPEIQELRERVRDQPEDASYYDRVRMGELVVAALERRREEDAAEILRRLEPLAIATASHRPGAPDEVINTAFLIDRASPREFEDAVEAVGADLLGRVRLRLLGPLAPYDFIPEA